jgi:hypothetical protein
LVAAQVVTSTVLGSALPAHVLFVQFDAGYSQYLSVSQRNVHVIAVNLLDHRDPVPEHCHAVALFQGVLLFAADAILLALFDEVVQPCRIEA